MSPPQTLSEEAYRVLKWKILSTELAPGSFLNEQDLAVATGFGRTPIHQALHRLQHDGLVEIRARKGVLVRGWSPQDVRHLVETRKPLEVSMVILAVERAQREEISAAADLLAGGPRLISAMDRDGLLRLDQDFHRSLGAMTRNPILAGVVESLHQRSTLLWFLPIADRKEYTAVQAHHERILQAIEARDPGAAAAAMVAHLDGFIAP